MSEPRSVIEEQLEEQFRIMGIPKELNPRWRGMLLCGPSGPSCTGCRTTFPGCKCSPRERYRRRMLELVELGKEKYNHNTKTTLCILHYLWCVGNMHFRPFGMRMETMFMSKSQAALMNLSLRQERLKIHTSNWCDIPSYMEIYVTQMFPNLTLSRNQAKLICNWVEDVFLALPMCVRKKMLMTSRDLFIMINN